MTEINLGSSRIIVLSGPSGSGKSTIVNRLVEESPVPLLKVISATTRSPRPAEKNGIDYYFLTGEEFDRRRDHNELLECAEVFGAGYWYGTLLSELKRANDSDKWALLEIDVEGAMQVVKKFPEAVTFFLKTPSEEEYENRLRLRGTEDEDKIKKRLSTARKELELSGHYENVIINEDLDRAVKEISEILINREAEFNARRI
jgi:guanylate kinase